MQAALITIGLVIYALPCWVAIQRRHRSQLAIGVLTLLLGWTVIGWVGALIWSLTSNIEAKPAGAARRCPYCAETIQAAALRCKHCQADLSSIAPRCSCGAAITPGAALCVRCGVRLS